MKCNDAVERGVGDLCSQGHSLRHAMYRLRCTEKLLSRLRAKPDPASPEPMTTLGNWYATVLFWKPQLSLLLNKKTFLPVCVPGTDDDARKSLSARVIARPFLLRCRQTLDQARGGSDGFLHAKTLNRSVVGRLNAFSFIARGLSRQIRPDGTARIVHTPGRYPCGPLNGLSPRRVLQDQFQLHGLLTKLK